MAGAANVFERAMAHPQQSCLGEFFATRQVDRAYDRINPTDRSNRELSSFKHALRHAPRLPAPRPDV